MEFEKRIFNLTVWLLAITALAVILTSCAFDPYAGLSAPTATAPAAVITVTPSPIPHYWTLAAGNPWHFTISQAEHSAEKGALK
jgi:hypothetical protein